MPQCTSLHWLTGPQPSGFTDQICVKVNTEYDTGFIDLGTLESGHW